MTINRLLQALIDNTPIYTKSGEEVSVASIDRLQSTVYGNGYLHYINDLTLTHRRRYRTAGLYDLVFDAERNLLCIDTGPTGEISKFSAWVMDDTNTIPFNNNPHDLRDFKQLFRAMAQKIGETL